LIRVKSDFKLGTNFLNSVWFKRDEKVRKFW